MNLRRWTIGAGLAVVVLAVCELILSFLLFNDVARGWSLARALRKPDLYADSQRSDLYWELQDRWLAPDERSPVLHDTQLGWRSRWIEPQTYEHVERAPLFDKRPILLFGDSYAQCNTSANECFQGLLASSGLGRKYHLLNFGVGGYGLDQELLLMPRVLDRYAAQKPIVLVGVLVDDDLDRCRLSFRCWPKPRFELAGDELVSRNTPVPTREQYHAPFRGSMLVRLLVHSVMPERVTSKLERRGPSDRALVPLVNRIVERMVDELEARHVDTLFLLFRAERSTQSLSKSDWRDRAVRDVLDRRKVAYLDLGEALRAKAAETGASTNVYFGGAPKLAGHYNAIGNRVAFEAIVAKLRSDFGVDLGLPPYSAAAISRTRARGTGGAARYEEGVQGAFGADDVERLCIEVGAGGPTEIDYDVAGGEARFTANASFWPDDKTKAGSVLVTLSGDGLELARLALRCGDARQPLVADLHGIQCLTIRVADAGDGNAGDVLLLSLPRFE